MKAQLLTLATFALCGGNFASAAFITYNNGITNTQGASGPDWVLGSDMFLNIIPDYIGSPSGASGGSASTQDGFDLFAPAGGGLDITLLSWTFGPMSLYQGAGSATLSPGPVSAGFEDYRYDTQGGTAPTNLTFFYNGQEWATGYVARFVTEVDHINDISATGEGQAFVTGHTPAGQAFYDELMALSNGSGELSFIATSFFPVSLTDPGTFGSAGMIEVVPAAIPEPSAAGFLLGIGALACGTLRRRR